MNNIIRFGDLLALLRKLGFSCDTVRGKVRVCEYPSPDTLILLTDRPAEQPVPPLTLSGVMVQLDKFGLMTRDAFDRWAKRQAKANADPATNGSGSVPKSRRRAVKEAT